MNIITFIIVIIVFIWVFKKITKTNWSKASDEKLFAEADKIAKKAEKKGLHKVGNHRDGCEYCIYVKRDSSAATNLKCKKKKIFVPASMACSNFNS